MDSTGCICEANGRGREVMMSRFLVVLLVLGCLSGCAGGKTVDGNMINYGPGRTFVVDASFQYLGATNKLYAEHIVNKMKLSSGTSENLVFGKKYMDTKELVELVFINRATPSDRTVYVTSSRGKKADQHFELLQFTKEFSDLFQENGFVTSQKFQCVSTERQIEARLSSSIMYCVASSVIPSDSNVREYLRKKYSESLREMQ